MGCDRHRTSYGILCTMQVLVETTFQQSCPETCESEAQTKSVPRSLPTSDLSFEHVPLALGQTDLNTTKSTNVTPELEAHLH